MHRETELVNFKQCPDDPFKASSMPIYQTATFELNPSFTESKYDYTRSGNPTRDAVQKQVANLEEGKFSLAFATGMAAINALTGILKTGSHIIAGDDLYGGTQRLLVQRLAEYRGINSSFVDLTDVTQLELAIKPDTKMIIFETPSNPLQKIVDIKAVTTIAHRHGIIVAVDNSFMSPWLQQPLNFGADVVIHSATKYLSGHADACGGFLVVNNEELATKLAFIQNAEGSALAPFEAWLILRGIKTLGLRISAQEQNAKAVIKFLQQQKVVGKIYYPTLETHPGVKIHMRQASGGGNIIAIETATTEDAITIANSCTLFKRTVSFGSVCSSLNIPGYTSHRAIKDKKNKLLRNLLRLSIGIENHCDLTADLAQAFALVGK